MNRCPATIPGKSFFPPLSPLLLLLASAAASASAQLPVPAPPPDSLTASWPPRQAFAASGVSPFASLTAEAWANLHGGIHQRSWINSLLDFGLELDTAKLRWWHGGSWIVQAHWVDSWRSDTCFSDYAGTFNPVSSAEAGDHFRIFNLHYRHSWRDDAFSLKIGQVAVDDDFMASDYSGLFINSAFGPLPSQVGTPLATSCGGHTAFPIYSVAAPGIVARARLADPLYTQLGLYHGTPGFDERSNFGFDWATESFRHFGLFWENGCNFNLAQRAATSRIGLSFHSGSLDDFNAPPGQSRDNPQSVPNFYAMHDQQLLAADDGKTVLGAFCRAGITPEPNLSLVAWYADAGLNWFAPLPSRPDDIAGFAVSYTRFGDDYRHSTGPNGVAPDETTLELTYRAQLTRWFALQADAQLLFNPAIDPASGSRETATVLGMRANITF
jgi:porin